MSSREYELRRYGDGWAIEDNEGSIVSRYTLHDTRRAVDELERLNTPPISLATRRAAADGRDAG